MTYSVTCPYDIFDVVMYYALQKRKIHLNAAFIIITYFRNKFPEILAVP